MEKVISMLMILAVVMLLEQQQKKSLEVQAFLLLLHKENNITMTIINVEIITYIILSQFHF